MTRATLSVLLLTPFTACARAGRPREAYAFEKSEPPLTMRWRFLRPDPGTLVAEGVVRNSLPNKFRFSQVTVTVLGKDGEGRIVSRSVTRIPDLTGATSRFRLVHPLSGPEASFALRFAYKTEDIEGNGGRN
ncbi:MAG: hypothetical protein HYV62_02460 [Candidatus Rokubacteria bacterium]|nr:hypothetical protein [Candidatus Rokubacteria bacterium]